MEGAPRGDERGPSLEIGSPVRRLIGLPRGEVLERHDATVLADRGRVMTDA
jgi:hypothetical protein